VKNNAAMKSYWAGYRAAKDDAYGCGLETAWNNYDYGLAGKSDAYCRGYRAYLNQRKKARCDA
jgi:ribosome modulation factor